MPGDSPAQHLAVSRIVLRPIGNPLPLGFLGLAVATVGFSALQLVAAGLMGLAATRFAVTGIYEITGSPAWKLAAGVTGLVVAAAAFYAATGFELEDAKRRTVLPLLRRGSGRLALRGCVADQLDGVAHETGVREQL